MERGVESKFEATRVLHLVTSRNFPAGGTTTREMSLLKHAETLHSHVEITEARRQCLRRMSCLIGKTVRKLQPAGHRSAGHTSLTSSASLDSGVKEGGRATEVGTKFRNWCTTVSDQDRLCLTWFGRPYWLIAGRPRWQTMCRETLIHEPHHEAGESSESMNLDFENFKLEDPLHGLDETTGYQLLQWSLEEGIRQGILVGSPYDDGESSPPVVNTAVAPSIRASAIGEPGAKSRIVTVGEDWLTMLLQPWSHHVIGELRAHPSAASGLTRGWQMFEWVKRLQNAAPPPVGNRYFLSSDLTTATDFCTHEYSLAMLEGLHKGLKLDKDPYFSLCAKLLCSGRTYEGPVNEFIDRVSTRGILMGDPGAKIVLTMHNLCAEFEAHFREVHGIMDCSDEELLYRLNQAKGLQGKPWRLFACSGDDHFGQGTREYLSCITRNHDRNGMSVSWPQNFLSPVGGFYCEEMLLTVGLDDGMIWKSNRALRDTPYLEQPHIDAMKIRLFSPCAKEHEGKDEPNPAIGKARQMHGMLSWLGGGWESMIPVFAARWEQRLAVHLPRNRAFRYLPVLLGGIEAPAYHLAEVEMVEILRALPAEHLFSIKQVLDGTAKPLLRRTLATFATNARARGISSDLIEDQIKETLQNMDLVHGLDDAGLQLAANIPTLEWRNLRFKDKAAIAKRMRLLTVDEAISIIGRPYLFRDMLYPEMSLRHGIDPYRSSQYENVPWAQRERKFYENLFAALPEDYRPLTAEEESTVIRRITKWAVQNEYLDIPREVYFFPESVVVVDCLATLRTPLNIREKGSSTLPLIKQLLTG
jgi:hypothetical protein